MHRYTYMYMYCGKSPMVLIRSHGIKAIITLLIEQYVFAGHLICRFLFLSHQIIRSSTLHRCMCFHQCDKYFPASPIVNGNRTQSVLGADNEAITDDEMMPYISVSAAGLAVQAKPAETKGITAAALKSKPSHEW